MAKPKEVVFFERPTVTGRLYSAKGPSGWLETFPRKQLDLQLQAFLGLAPIDQVVATFITLREVDDDEPTTWQTVIGYLGRMVGLSPLEVPPEIGLAFWGRVELELATRQTQTN